MKPINKGNVKIFVIFSVSKYMRIYLHTKATNEDMKKFGVYAIKNIINGNFYIGSTTTYFQERLSEHYRNLIKNEHTNKYFQNAWNKYGKKNFEFLILEILNNKNNVINREQFWLDYYKINYKIYNICLIANSTLGVKPTQEHLDKISKEWIIVNPLNVVFYVKNMCEFCRTNKLPQRAIHDSATHRRTHYKGWFAYNLAEFSIERLITDRNDIQKNKYKLISPNNEIFIVNNMRRFCLEYELDHSCLFNICGGAGNRGQHKGWRIEKLARDEITKKDITFNNN